MSGMAPLSLNVCRSSAVPVDHKSNKVLQLHTLRTNTRLTIHRANAQLKLMARKIADSNDAQSGSLIVWLLFAGVGGFPPALEPLEGAQDVRPAHHVLVSVGAANRRRVPHRNQRGEL